MKKTTKQKPTREEVPVDKHWQPQNNSVNNIAGIVLTKHEIPDSEKKQWGA